MTVMNSISHFMEKRPHSSRLTLTAIAAATLTATALLSYQRLTRSRYEQDKTAFHKVIREEKPSGPALISLIDEEAHKAMDSGEEADPVIDETLVEELLARNIAFFGAEGVHKIRKGFVVVLGAGAVGSWTALMLVRSGLGHIRIIDKGVVGIEHLTRHAVAKVDDVGQSKAHIMKRYLSEIAPQAKVETRQTDITLDQLDKLLSATGKKPDYVVDTLTHVKDKVVLAKYCTEHNIKIVSAMSAGYKADPTLIQMTDVNLTMADPLARMYRRQLRKLGIDRGVPVVYSVEKAVHLNKDSVSEDFRTRSLPVLSPVASMFGMALTTYILLQLAEFEAYKLPTNKMRDGVYARMQKELASREQFVFNNTNELLDTNQVGYIFDEIWQGKSAVSGAQDRTLVMTRWDTSKKSSLVNTVVMTKEEASLHDQLPQGTDLTAHYGADVVDRINKQFSLEGKLQELWKAVA